LETAGVTVIRVLRRGIKRIYSDHRAPGNPVLDDNTVKGTVIAKGPVALFTFEYPVPMYLCGITPGSYDKTGRPPSF